MKRHGSRAMHRGQRGFTLIEMAVALAITGLIGVGAAATTAQVLGQTTHNTDYTAASRHTLNAIHWIARDALMAQTVDPGGSSGFPLTLGWIEWDNTVHQVIYVLEEGRLRRSHSVDGGEPSVTVVAECISPDAELTNCEFTGAVLTLKVTATVGEGAGATSVTKVRDIIPRPFS